MATATIALRDLCPECRAKLDAETRWFNGFTGLIVVYRRDEDRRAAVEKENQARYQRRLSTLLAGRE
jgi:hypothetical protein